MQFVMSLKDADRMADSVHPGQSGLGFIVMNFTVLIWGILTILDSKVVKSNSLQ